MNRDLQKKLITTYPNLFIHEEGYDGTFGNIRFGGFQCHDGWYILIDELMRVIDFHIRFNSKPKVQLKEVKEKFGILSFDFRGGDEYIRGMVMFAMHMSSKMCEFCGTSHNVGKTSPWISVCCKNCHDTIDNRKDLHWRPNQNPRFMKLVKIKKILKEK